MTEATIVYSERFRLLSDRQEYDQKLSRNVPINIFLGSDNLLNERYRLGNDLNAFGGRHFNPAPSRSIYGI